MSSSFSGIYFYLTENEISFCTLLADRLWRETEICHLLWSTRRNRFYYLLPTSHHKRWASHKYKNYCPAYGCPSDWPADKAWDRDDRGNISICFFSPKPKHMGLLNIVNSLSFVFLSFSMNGDTMVMTKEAETLDPGNFIMVTQVSTGQCLREISPGNHTEMTQDQVELYPGKTSWTCCMMFITFSSRQLMATSWGRAGNSFMQWCEMVQ